MTTAKISNFIDALTESAIVGAVAIALSATGVQSTVSGMILRFMPGFTDAYAGYISLFITVASGNLVYNVYKMYR